MIKKYLDIKKYGVHYLLIVLLISFAFIALQKDSVLKARANDQQTAHKVAAKVSVPNPPAVSLYIFNTDFGFGARGEQVNELQKRLGIKTSGSFDAGTLDAVLGLQLKTGLISSKTEYGAGYVGRRTRDFLNTGRITRNITIFSNQTTISPKPTNSHITAQPTVTYSPVAQPVKVEDKATVVISGLGSYDINISDSDNAFSILKKSAAKYGFSLEYKEYSWGVMVTRIGGKEAEGSYYWALYYNGSYSDVGAGDLKILNNDITEWRYESWE